MKKVNNIIILFVLVLSLINPLVISAEEITYNETENVNDPNKKDDELASAATDIVNIPDPELEKCIRNTYPPITGDLTVGKLESIKTLSCVGVTINDLSGIEYLKNLELLNFISVELNDIELIGSLTNLKSVGIQEASLTDISPLSNLANLESLDLFGNQITDFSPLSKLSKLSSTNFDDQTPNIDLGTFTDINDFPASFPIVGIDGTKYNVELDTSSIVEGENIITTNYSFDSYLYTGNLTTKLTYHSIPKIDGADDIKIEVGTDFDPMQGVSASDIEDGDLTSSIKIISNDLDTSKVGTYKIMYSVTDSDGNKAEKSRNVKVYDDSSIKPSKPDDNSLTPDISSDDKSKLSLVETGSNIQILSIVLILSLILTKKFVYKL